MAMDKKKLQAFAGGPKSAKPEPAKDDLDTEMDTGDADGDEDEDGDELIPTDIEEKYGDIITAITEDADAVYDQLDMLDADTFSDPEMEVDEEAAGILTDALAALPEGLVQAMASQGAEIPWEDSEAVADALVAEEVIDSADHAVCAGFLYHGCRAAASGEGAGDDAEALGDEFADDEMA